MGVFLFYFCLFLLGPWEVNLGPRARWSSALVLSYSLNGSLEESLSTGQAGWCRPSISAKDP